MPDKNFDKMLKVYGVKPVELGEDKVVDKKNEGGKGLDPKIKRNWEDIQKRYQYPVNAIGVRIDPKDKETLRVWKENGIDKFVKS
jgi:hypothetical protein